MLSETCKLSFHSYIALYRLLTLTQKFAIITLLGIQADSG